MVKAVSDVTVGTVIVLVHIALADRNKRLHPHGALVKTAQPRFN